VLVSLVKVVCAYISVYLATNLSNASDLYPFGLSVVAAILSEECKGSANIRRSSAVCQKTAEKSDFIL
jgi:hypothetical protein